MKQNNKKYVIDLSDLDSSELESILKSNVLSWDFRRFIHMEIAFKLIKEFIPVMASLSCASLVLDIIEKRGGE